MERSYPVAFAIMTWTVGFAVAERAAVQPARTLHVRLAADAFAAVKLIDPSAAAVKTMVMMDRRTMPLGRNVNM